MREGKISEQSIEYLKGLRFPIPCDNSYLNVSFGPGFGSTAYPVKIEEVGEPLQKGDKVRVKDYDDSAWRMAYFINNDSSSAGVLCATLGRGFSDRWSVCEKYDWNEKDLLKLLEEAVEG